MIIISTNHPNLRFSRKDVLRALNYVHQGEGKEIPALAVILTHSRFIRRINRKFLRNDCATDVIAFPLGDGGGVEAEIYVNLDAAHSQAREYSVSYTQEARRLLIHGLLHLLGYSDKNVRETSKMRAREDFYLELMSRNIKI